jgi:hypothetical protein
MLSNRIKLYNELSRFYDLNFINHIVYVHTHYNVNCIWHMSDESAKTLLDQLIKQRKEDENVN